MKTQIIPILILYLILPCFMAMLKPAPSFALLRQITNDAGTQKKKESKVEISYIYDHNDKAFINRNPGRMLSGYMEFGQVPYGRMKVLEDVNQVRAVFAYGIIDTLEIAMSLPYLHERIKERLIFYSAGPLQGYRMKSRETASGLGDLGAEFKWNFYTADFGNDWSFKMAVKPAVKLPVGNEDQGLGTGRVGFSGTFIAGLYLTPVAILLNAAYIRNENILNERQDLWNASLTLEYRVWKYITLVASCGLTRNKDKRSNVSDLIILGGVVAKLTDTVDIDAGFKSSLSPRHHESPGPDYGIIAGVSIRFPGPTGNEAKIAQ